MQKKTKLEVIKAEKQACEDLYDELSRPEGHQKIYRLAKARDEVKDGYQGLFVKDKNGVQLFRKDQVVKRWKKILQEVVQGEQRSW